MLEQDASASTMRYLLEELIQKNTRLREIVVQLSNLSVKNVMNQEQVADNPYLPRLCHPDECVHCSLADQANQAPCLRRKAELCINLSKILDGEDRAALERVSFNLADLGCVVNREFLSLSLP